MLKKLMPYSIFLYATFLSNEELYLSQMYTGEYVLCEYGMQCGHPSTKSCIRASLYPICVCVCVCVCVCMQQQMLDRRRRVLKGQQTSASGTKFSSMQSKPPLYTYTHIHTHTHTHNTQTLIHHTDSYTYTIDTPTHTTQTHTHTRSCRRNFLLHTVL